MQTAHEDVIDAFMNELEYQQQVSPNSTGTAALKWAKDEIHRLRTALRVIANEEIIQGMSPSLFARSILEE